MAAAAATKQHQQAAVGGGDWRPQATHNRRTYPFTVCFAAVCLRPAGASAVEQVP
jgi:hypothetical protein